MHLTRVVSEHVVPEAEARARKACALGQRLVQHRRYQPRRVVLHPRARRLDVQIVARGRALVGVVGARPGPRPRRRGGGVPVPVEVVARVLHPTAHRLPGFFKVARPRVQKHGCRFCHFEKKERERNGGCRRMPTKLLAGTY